MQIRSARGADADAVNELLAQLGYPQGDRSTTTSRIQNWLDDRVSAVYVADLDAALLGVIAVHACPFLEREGAWARITVPVVSERARGRGVGTRLVAAAEAFAMDRGCVRMEVTSGDQRSDAHEFYERRGYVDQAGRSTRFVRELPD